MRSGHNTCRICKQFKGDITDTLVFSFKKQYVFKQPLIGDSIPWIEMMNFLLNLRSLTKIIIFIMAYHHVHYFHHDCLGFLISLGQFK